MRSLLVRRTTYDLSLLLIVFALLAIGLAMVYSASGIRALDTLDEPRYFLLAQSAWAALGVVGLLIAARTDYHRYRTLALPGLLLAVALLVLVLVPGVGTSAGGATRWLRLTSFAGVQPAEIAKLALVVYLAFWFAARRAQIGSSGVALGFVATSGLVAGLIVAEPDLGTAIVVGVIALAMYFVAGARLRVFLALGTLAGVLLATLAVVQPYRLQRVFTFLDPWSDPRGAGFQTIQALYALALGGPFGEGLGAGKEKFGYLPAPYTDSIFAVLGNELGLFGTLAVVFLFLAFAFKGTRIALRAPDPAGALLATGITVWIGFQAWLNMAVVASVAPMTGITLPFISYGGSSLCLGLIAVGILLNVGRQAVRDEPHDRKARVPRAAGRGRDGGARQPAPGRGGSAVRAATGRPVPLRGWSSRLRG